jgi:hypothetical protein
MTKKQGVRAVADFLVMKAQDTAKEALSDNVEKGRRDYLVTKSVIIIDLIKDL